MSKVIKWGIIGAGKIAHKFAQDLSTISQAELYAIASSSKERAHTFAKEYKVNCAYDSYEALVKDPNIDAVYIATPHSFHLSHTLLCLNNFKPVLCEKPFAMNLDEVEQMIALSKRNGVLLMEAMWTAFLPHFIFAIQTVKEQHFGKVLRLEADFGFNPPYDESSRLFNKALGGGSLLDIGIYPVFAALSALGEHKYIDATATYFETGADASCNVTFKYNDAKAILKSTFLKQTQTEAVFYCEEGIIKINGRFHQPSNVSLISKTGKEEIIEFNYNSIGYSYEIEHFNDLIRSAAIESPVMSFERSLHLIKTLDAIRHQIGLEYT